MSQFMTIIRRFHGTRCIINTMGKYSGRDTNAFNHLIQESNRQKLEARIVELEQTVKHLNEKVKNIEKVSYHSEYNNSYKIGKPTC